MINIYLQNATSEKNIPHERLLQNWTLAALAEQHKDGEITVLIVDADEMQNLNKKYRYQNKATNVLAFPFSPFDNIESNDTVIGDVVICGAVVNAEAKQQQKGQEAHWAHIIIHGVLHLLGYAHDNAQQASIMQAIEVERLKELGYVNPYI